MFLCFKILHSNLCFFFFSSRRRHTICLSDWSSDVCSSDLDALDRQSSVSSTRSALPLLLASLPSKIRIQSCYAHHSRSVFRILVVKPRAGVPRRPLIP